MSPPHTCPLRVQRRPTNGDRRWKINCNKRGNTRGPLAPELNVETLSLPARRKILLSTLARGRWRSTLKLGARATVLCSVVAIYFPLAVKMLHSAMVQRSWLIVPVVAMGHGAAKLAHGPHCAVVTSAYLSPIGDLVAI